MKEKIEALQVAAHKAARDGEYDKALEILDSLQKNHNVATWDVIFYRTFYRYGKKGMEKTSLTHIETINQAVVESFAVVLSQNVDILETLVAFQDVYDQIWDLSTRLQQSEHRGYIGVVKGKSITDDFYKESTQKYVDNLKTILTLSDNFINALGNLADFTVVNHDLIWDFFQCNDGLFCFLSVYDEGDDYEKKREENIKVIQLKRPDYIPQSLPTKVMPAELREKTEKEPKKKGFFSRFFS